VAQSLANIVNETYEKVLLLDLKQTENYGDNCNILDAITQSTAPTTGEGSTMSNNKKDKYKVYNSCHQNWYETGYVTRPHCDWHPVHVPGMPIWSVSWEGPRRFVLIPEYKDGFKDEIIVMSGDLIVMGGTCYQCPSDCLRAYQNVLRHITTSSDGL
jgi:hypothetical protein